MKKSSDRVVDGPPELANSARAEAQGLLTMLMTASRGGWFYDLDLRLDNSGVVSRAGGLACS